jgi:hypothetical protein
MGLQQLLGLTDTLAVLPLVHRAPAIDLLLELR